VLAPVIRRPRGGGYCALLSVQCGLLRVSANLGEKKAALDAGHCRRGERDRIGVFAPLPVSHFAVGDVRAGNIKRVASAVGEGSIAVAFVRVLQQT